MDDQELTPPNRNGVQFNKAELERAMRDAPIQTAMAVQHESSLAVSIGWVRKSTSEKARE
jgi:hypothetical protein